MISVLGLGYLASVGHHAVFIFCVSDAHNFTANPSNVCDYGYHAFGELARFTYCLLQLVKSAIITPGREVGGFNDSQPFSVPSY